MLRMLAIVLLLLLGVGVARAQAASAVAVTTCGTQTYVNGQPFPLTVDLTGKLCDGASGGGSSANPYYTKSAPYVSAGAGQYGLAVATATSLTVPSGAISAEICVESANIRYRDDGTAPTATTGMPVSSGTCFQYAGPLSAIQFIAQSGSPTIDVSYYK